MNQSTINIDVKLDDTRMVETIQWQASDSTAGNAQKAKAMMLSFWDGAEKAALRIDLWTKDMMVDEMADFYYQMFSSMADTYERATNQKELSADIKNFAKEFQKKFRATQVKM